MNKLMVTSLFSFSKKNPIFPALLFLLCLIWAQPSYAVMGDVDGSGAVDIEDARCLAAYLAGEISSLPQPGNADVTQDGKIDMDDAYTISKYVAGKSRVLVVASRYGSVGSLRMGDIIRIEAFEKFCPFNITGGTVRITSASTGYDSGAQPLTFERSGRSLYYDWDTAGLEPASDFQITVNLTKSSSSPSSSSLKSDAISSTVQPAAAKTDVLLPLTGVVALSDRIFEPTFLAKSVDAVAPTPGIPLVFRRVYPYDSAHYPYLGPLGRGWTHNYDIFLEEYTDGQVVCHGIDGSFQSNADGTYTSSPGNYGILTRDRDGTFQLQEKDGLIYRFLSNLHLNYIQDLNGNSVTAIYDGSGRLVEIRHSCGLSFHLAYDARGRLISLTDHVGRVTNYEYWPADTTDFVLTKVTDPAGAETNYTYNWVYARIVGPVIVGGTPNPDISNFRLKSITFPDGTATNYEYDSQAHLTKQTGAWGANPVTYTYDANGTTHLTDALGGQTSTKVDDQGKPLLVKDPSDSITSMTYDASENLTKVTDPLSHNTMFDYDGAGNIVKTTNALGQSVNIAYDSRFNKPTSITDAMGKITLFSYDSKGNLLSTIFPDLNSEHYTYDSSGNQLTSQDACGKVTSRSYNSNGQIAKIQNALGNTTSFLYDANGDLADVNNAKGITAVSFDRDVMGRVTRRTYPDSSHEDYEYNPAGKMTAFTDRNGNSISFAYDPTGRLEWKTYPSGRKLHYQYDAAGYYGWVEEVAGKTTASIEAYERDAAHRITKVKVPGKTEPASYDVSYAYDAAGRRRFMAYPDGYGLNYTYDAANRLIKISDANDANIVSYQYDATGRRTRRTLGNGTYTTYEYDNRDRLTLLTNYAPDANIQSRFSYTYNTAGMRTSTTTLEGTHKYTYDDTYQLTNVVYPDSRKVDYVFDEVGNRISVTDNNIITNYTTNDLDQYTQVGSETLEYDLNGNLIKRTAGSNITNYQWDEDNRLIGVDINGIHIDYYYDEQGRLIAKMTGGQEIRYIWDDMHIIAEVDSAGNVVKRYIYGPIIDEAIAINTAGTRLWDQQDGLGSVVGTTNNIGAVTATASYDVYGNIRTGNLGPVPQRFAGMWWDEDAGLFYVQARWYSPTLGRFLQPDPVRFAGGLNLYAYVGNSPINFVDPLGLWEIVVSIPTPWLVGPGFSFGHNDKTGQNSFSFGLGGGAGFAFLPNSQPTPGLSGSGFIYAGPFGLWGSESPGGTSGGGGGFGLGGGFGVQWTWTWPDGKPRNPNSLGGPGTGVGICPTFIQLPTSVKSDDLHKTYVDANQEQLVGKITVPINDCLLRSDIPIFGIAGGKDFKDYQVEYGEGKNPEKWIIITESNQPQEKCPDFKDISWMQGDLDIRGNLATWNTGLKNWVHLPWHPPEDTTDLCGVYTIRLVVDGKDGKTVEDRVTGEVGRAIAQCLPGIAISPDKQVIMRFPEQALTHPFRVYTILPLSDVNEETPASPTGCRFVGQAYRIREPGDRFAKDVQLEFNTTEIKPTDQGHIGICNYDAKNNKWVWLETKRNENATAYSTVLTELPTPRAIYALVLDPKKSHSSVFEPNTAPPVFAGSIRPGVLVDCNFESDLGVFKARDRFVGAELTRDKTATPDGTYCLKLTNTNFGGNFSCTVLDRPFDVREYPIMTFDYRIGPEVKVDFFLKVNGRWYRLRFTGDKTDFRFKDVNIQNMGDIQDILTDDKWHTASVDLRYLLTQQTHHTRIDEIMIADWKVGGYMKLDFGNNPRNAAYYIDNFKLEGTGIADNEPPILLIDNFESNGVTNALGGASGTYCTPGTHYIESSVAESPSQAVVGQAAGKNHELQLSFDMNTLNAYGGYWTGLQGRNISDYSTLRFRLRTQGTLPTMNVGIRNKAGVEGKTFIVPYAESCGDENAWDVKVPLSALRGLTDFFSPDVLFFNVSNKDNSGRGTVWIDDVRLEQAPVAKIADFEPPLTWDYLGGEYSTHQNGAAAISVSFMPDVTVGQKAKNTACRISYGGSIGHDYGSQGGFSYCVWQCGLNGTDAGKLKYLTLKIRGEKGGETPNIYLDDAAKRCALRAKEIPRIERQWQEIKLPLEYFAAKGIDLSRLESLELVFEWAEQSGTIYVDDIKFE